jgi:hypothetical protein
MKIRISAQEWYPVWKFDDDGVYPDSVTVDVPDSTVDRWKRIHDEFDKVQAEMRSYAPK